MTGGPPWGLPVLARWMGWMTGMARASHSRPTELGMGAAGVCWLRLNGRPVRMSWSRQGDRSETTQPRILQKTLQRAQHDRVDTFGAVTREGRANAHASVRNSAQTTAALQA